jgi:hypothetical protein
MLGVFHILNIAQEKKIFQWIDDVIPEFGNFS